MRYLSLGALVGLLLASNTVWADEVSAPAAPADDEARVEDTGEPEETSDAQFLAFLEYLGSWEESDEEWQAFHPDEGLSEIRLPAPRERGAPGRTESDDDTWDDSGRS